MGWYSGIRVISNAEPRRGAKVTIEFSGIIGTIGSAHTDSEGWAKFDYPNIDKYSMAVDRIWIDGKQVDGAGTLDRGETRSYSL